MQKNGSRHSENRSSGPIGNCGTKAAEETD
jgi:hypothetical protein